MRTKLRTTLSKYPIRTMGFESLQHQPKSLAYLLHSSTACFPHQPRLHRLVKLELQVISALSRRLCLCVLVVSIRNSVADTRHGDIPHSGSLTVLAGAKRKGRVGSSAGGWDGVRESIIGDQSTQHDILKRQLELQEEEHALKRRSYERADRNERRDQKNVRMRVCMEEAKARMALDPDISFTAALSWAKQWYDEDNDSD